MGFFDFFKSSKKEEVKKEAVRQQGLSENMLENETYGTIFLTVDKSMLLKNDIYAVLNQFAMLLASPKALNLNHNVFELTFSGYDFDRRELFEIPEVRNYVIALNQKCPFWFCFLNFNGTALMALMHCLTYTKRLPTGQIATDSESFQTFFANCADSLDYLVEKKGLSRAKADQMVRNARSYYRKYGMDI